MFGRWRKRGERRRAAKQQANGLALDREGDPRGGVQDDEYRHADPRDVIVSQGVAMSGPGGAPQEETIPEERRSNDRG